MKQSMKKILSVFLAAIMIFGAAAGIGGIDLGEFAFTAEAAEVSGVCGPNLTWTFDDETGELVIKGEGDMFVTNSWASVPWASIRAAIKKVTIEYGVTSIGHLAFGSCSNLETVTIPETVKTIGRNSFSYCSSLKSITIPDSVISIGEVAFERCGRLVTVNIGKGVETIESKAFNTCDSLLNVNFSADGNLKTIGEMAFGNCPSLKTITIPESVETIGAGAFFNCAALENFTIGKNVKYIGNETFSGNHGAIRNVYYTGSVEDWCNIEFAGNYSNPQSTDNGYHRIKLHINGELLTDLVIPDSVTEIKRNVFERCHHLKSVKIGSGVEKIDYGAFSACVNLETVDFGENGSLTEIGDRAFSGCSKITTDGKSTLKIPDSVKTIGESAFAGCDFALKNLIIGNSVTEIDNYAFNHCRLTHVTIGDSVEYVWDHAFDMNGNTITDVCYTGTEEEWEAITITRGNDELVNATRHYNYDPATHTHDYVETITRNPDCTGDGEALHTCYCGDRYTSVIPANGHTPSDWIITRRPTCTEEGERIKKCTKCYSMDEGGETYGGYVILEKEAIPALGHTPGDWRTERYPTCTEDGEKSKYCTICRVKLETEAIPAKGHVDGEWVYDVQPTCTEDGRGVLHCSKCYEVIREDVVPATGHTPGEWTITTEPTADKEGKKEKFCEVCGEKLEEAVIAKIPVMENLINAPSKTTVNYIDSITLTVDASKIPEGGYVVWNVDNFNFIPVEDGNDLHITSFSSGDTTFTATVYDAEGNAVGTDTQVVNSKAGFFQKIIAFFKILFGLAKAI